MIKFEDVKVGERYLLNGKVATVENKNECLTYCGSRIIKSVSTTILPLMYANDATGMVALEPYDARAEARKAAEEHGKALWELYSQCCAREFDFKEPQGFDRIGDKSRKMWIEFASKVEIKK